ncbi:MAG TPA: ABC transporter permease [Acidimicrobiia bacterium]|nr:ABC transporter permease [Acidimicrobiia bacterium]
MSGSGRKAALKVAFRNSVRNRKRTFFLVALVAVPVALAVVVAGLVRASTFTQEEQAQMEFGSAEMKARAWSNSRDLSNEVMLWAGEALAEIAPQTDQLIYRQAYVSFGSSRYGRALDLDMADPMAHGILGMIDGAPPNARGEIAVSPKMAERLEASIGETVELEIGELLRDYRLVGIASPPILTTDDLVLMSPDGLDEVLASEGNVETSLLIGGVGSVEAGTRLGELWEGVKYQFWPEGAVLPKPGELSFLGDDVYSLLDQAEVDELVALAGNGELAQEDYDQIQSRAYEMAEDGDFTYGSLPEFYVDGRAAWLSQGLSVDQQSSLASTAAAALLLVEVAFVAGAAFAAGTRRRLREIGLLGANGASEKHVRVTVLGEGLAIGIIGSAAGLVLGIAILFLGRPLIQPFVTRVMTGFGVSPIDMIGPVLVAIVSVVIAAWLPARTAARVPTTTALQGRMPALAPRKWVVPVGFGLTGFGTLLVTVALASVSSISNVLVGTGALMMVGGVALLASPILAVVSKLANRFPATGRLVLRDSGRHRTRSAVAVAATMVILLAPVMALTLDASQSERELVMGLPEPEGHLLLSGTYDLEGFGEVGPIADGDVAQVASIVPESFVARFDALNLTADLKPRFVAGSTVQVGYCQEPCGWNAATGSPDLVAALGVPEVGAALDGGDIVVLGLEEGPTTVRLDDVEYPAVEYPVPVLRFGMPRVLIPESRLDDFEDAERSPRALFILERSLTEDEWRQTNDGGLEIMGGYPGLSTTQVYALAFGATLVAVLIVVALVTAVSAAETDEEIRTIVAVGAPGSIRRRFLGLLTGYQTTVAIALALPLGVLLIWVFSSAEEYFYSGPFGQISTAALVVPVWPLLVLAVSLPLLIGFLTTLSVRSAPVTPPRRPT